MEIKIDDTNHAVYLLHQIAQVDLGLVCNGFNKHIVVL